MGGASRSLSGNQAEKVVFNGSPSEHFGPQSAKPGLLSAGEPASAFEGSSGVVAGTVPRRWNGNGGGRRWGPVSQVAGPVSSAKVFGPVSGYVESDSGNTQFCGELRLTPTVRRSMMQLPRLVPSRLIWRMHSSMVQRMSWASRCPRVMLLSRTFSTVP